MMKWIQFHETENLLRTIFFGEKAISVIGRIKVKYVNEYKFNFGAFPVQVLSQVTANNFLVKM